MKGFSSQIFKHRCCLLKVLSLEDLCILNQWLGVAEKVIQAKMKIDNNVWESISFWLDSKATFSLRAGEIVEGGDIKQWLYLEMKKQPCV